MGLDGTGCHSGVGIHHHACGRRFHRKSVALGMGQASGW